MKLGELLLRSFGGQVFHSAIHSLASPVAATSRNRNVHFAITMMPLQEGGILRITDLGQ